MKLITEHEQHQDIFAKGFRFNPEDETFFTSNKKKFKLPENYEDWKVEVFEKDAYLLERLEELGIDPEENSLELTDKDGQKCKMQVFTANVHGDIEILQYSLKRHTHIYKKGETTAGVRWEYHVRKRLNPLYAPFCEGKYDGSESKNVPFWHPDLITMFENEESIDTLVITEGQFKAFKATKEGIPTVGLNSINHYRDRRTNGLHPEIIEFIHKCGVKKVVILWDGDCRNISSKHLEAGTELTERPNGFFVFARTIKSLLQKVFPPKKLEIYFATIKTDDIEGAPKGIDDLLLVKKIKTVDVVADFDRVGTIPGYYIEWINITSEPGVKSMRQYFQLSYPSDFYRFHSEQIKGKNFVYYGTTYRIENGVPLVEVDKNLKKYMRIGPDYFRLIEQSAYNEEGDKIRTDEVLVPWSATEINRDFGKNAVNNVMRLDGFCNIPNNTNFKQIVDNKWNLYYDVKHDTAQGEWKNIESFLKHIFQDQYEMGLDYLQLLYTKPYQKLPVLGLVSREEGTGKSTFLKLLYMMFQNNMTYVTPDDIMGNWTSHWVSKLIVACEETFFEKKEAGEKIKNLSTADKVMRSERFVNNTLIDCFLKFVFCSNFEDDFIKLNDGSSRFWIIKVKQIEGKSDPNFVQLMQDEIGYFMHFLQNRSLVNEKKDRMYFHPDQFKTDAFRNIVKNSEPGVVKNLRIQIEEYFMKYGVPELKIDAKNLRNFFDVRVDDFYMTKILDQYFNVYKTDVTTFKFHNDDTVISGKGRAFVFKNKNFSGVIQEEVKEDELPF